MVRRSFCGLFFMFFVFTLPYRCSGEVDMNLIKQNMKKHVETVLTDNIKLSSNLELLDSLPTSLFEYSRTVYDNIDDKIHPEDFTENQIISINDFEKDKLGTVMYYLENDALLALLYGNTIRYRTHNGNNYYQLWVLENEEIKTSPCQELDFMSIDQAKETALRFLTKYQIFSPCIQDIYSVNQGQLEELTFHMLTQVAPEVSEYFPTIQKEHEAYYITLGHSFNGIPMAEQSNDLICISSEGISCIELSKVGNEYKKDVSIGSILSFSDALKIFIEDQKDILQECTIDKIELAYSVKEKGTYHLYSPQWVIHSYYIPATLYKTNDQIALGETCLIDAVTGNLCYLNTTELIYIE